MSEKQVSSCYYLSYRKLFLYSTSHINKETANPSVLRTKRRLSKKVTALPVIVTKYWYGGSIQNHDKIIEARVYSTSFDLQSKKILTDESDKEEKMVNTMTPHVSRLKTNVSTGLITMSSSQCLHHNVLTTMSSQFQCEVWAPHSLLN